MNVQEKQSFPGNFILLSWVMHASIADSEDLKQNTCQPEKYFTSAISTLKMPIKLGFNGVLNKRK